MLLRLIVVLIGIFGVGIFGAAVPVGLHGRIVGGASTHIGEFPWLVSLQRQGSHSCAASIYNNNILVTVAHCVQHVAVTALRVRAGSTYWNSGGVLVPVAKFRIHEGYDARSMLNDLAVVRLKSIVNFGVDIWYITLARQPPANGATAVVAGWGVISHESSTMPSGLQSVKVQTIGRAQCASSAYGYGSAITSSAICAAADGKGVCNGDDGSALVVDGQLIGVYSWSYGCAFANYPGIYTDVTQFRLWIANAANDLSGYIRFRGRHPLKKLNDIWR